MAISSARDGTTTLGGDDRGAVASILEIVEGYRGDQQATQGVLYHVYCL